MIYYLLNTVKNVSSLHRFEKLRLQSIFCVGTLVFDDFFQTAWHAVYQFAAIIWSDVSNQTSLIAVWSASRLEGCFSETFLFVKFHKFSIGFKSWLFPGHCNLWIGFCSTKFFTTLFWWHGAPSCMKISQLWTLMWSSSLLFNKLTYLSPFIVVLGGKK